MNHIYYFSSDERKSYSLTAKIAFVASIEQHGHLRYAKSTQDFWDGKGYEARRIKRAYRNAVTA